MNAADPWPLLCHRDRQFVEWIIYSVDEEKKGGSHAIYNWGEVFLFLGGCHDAAIRSLGKQKNAMEAPRWVDELRRKGVKV